MTERRYPHPGFGNGISHIDLQLWEIRNQLEINIENIKRDCPVSEDHLKFFGHPIEMATEHVFDRLNELESMLIKELRK